MFPCPSGYTISYSLLRAVAASGPTTGEASEFADLAPRLLEGVFAGLMILGAHRAADAQATTGVLDPRRAGASLADLQILVEVPENCGQRIPQDETIRRGIRLRRRRCRVDRRGTERSQGLRRGLLPEL